MPNNKTKFTPAPWYASVVHDEVYDGESNFQTEDFSVIDSGGDFISTDISSKANMKLIVVAPEMYDILERVVALSDGNNIYPMIPLGRVIEDIVEDAKKVLKKTICDEDDKN